MNQKDREFFEKNDLTLLHALKSDKRSVSTLEFSMSSHKKRFGEDLWTRALYSLEGTKDELLHLKAEVIKSDWPMEVKAWWETVFAIKMHAPLEELTRLSVVYSKVDGADKCSTKCILAAAAVKAEQARTEEANYRASIDQREQDRLSELQSEVALKEKQLDGARENYDTHHRNMY